MQTDPALDNIYKLEWGEPWTSSQVNLPIVSLRKNTRYRTFIFHSGLQQWNPPFYKVWWYNIKKKLKC